MAKILLTGMSGTGKSTALRGLAALGHRTVDADHEGWSVWTRREDGSLEWAWDERVMSALLAEAEPAHHSLVVAGCAFNQGRFYDRFDHVVLLSAPAEVLLERIDGRTDNLFGKSDTERRQVLADLETVEPLLRAGAGTEIDTTCPPDEVVARIDALTR
jgi:shikimate kinase